MLPAAREIFSGALFGVLLNGVAEYSFSAPADEAQAAPWRCGGDKWLEIANGRCSDDRAKL
jgi:hypothetical protein